MKQNKRILFPVIIALIIVLSSILSKYNIKKNQTSINSSTNINIEYISFSSSNPEMNFSFDYPKNWKKDKITTGEFEKYTNITIWAPQNDNEGATPEIHVSVFPFSSKGSRYQNLEDLLNYIRNKGQLISEKETSISEIKAKDLSVASTQMFSEKLGLDPSVFYNLRLTRKVSMRERHIIFKKNDRLYDFGYGSAKADYQKYEPIFDHMVAAFKFTKEK